MASQNQQPEVTRVIRLRDVTEITGLSAATVWRLARNDGKFPKPFQLSPGATVWDCAELMEWLETRKASRGKA